MEALERDMLDAKEEAERLRGLLKSSEKIAEARLKEVEAANSEMSQLKSSSGLLKSEAAKLTAERDSWKDAHNQLSSERDAISTLMMKHDTNLPTLLTERDEARLKIAELVDCVSSLEVHKVSFRAPIYNRSSAAHAIFRRMLCTQRSRIWMHLSRLLNANWRPNAKQKISPGRRMRDVSKRSMD